MKLTFLALLGAVSGTAISQPEQWPLQRERVISRLEPVLRNPNDKAAIVMALAILEDLKSTGSIPIAIPLLKHPDTEVQAAAAQLIAIAPPRESLQALCDALDTCDVKTPRLEAGLGRALVALDDPAALPALRRANKRRLFGTVSWALGHVGERQDSQLLLEAALLHDSMDALEGFVVMVCRSNKPYEAWMSKNEFSPKTGLAHKQDWQVWWDSNKCDFQIVKTAKEAFERK